MIFRWIILVIIGLGGGICVSGGLFAFLSILELIPRLLSRFHISSEVYYLETMIFLGGLFGSLLSVFHWKLMLGEGFMALYGFFSGIFVGCLAMSLAETVKVIPILIRRLKLKAGLPVLVLMIALGKALASFYQLYFRFHL